VHAAPARFSDPARYSLAHGGKDGHPFPVPRRVYDETIRVMKDAIARARLGQSDRLFAIQRLDAEARRLERSAPAVDFDAFVTDEWARSPERDGMTAAGPVVTSPSSSAPPARAPTPSTYPTPFRSGQTAR
jgi:hypothetical protein